MQGYLSQFKKIYFPILKMICLILKKKIVKMGQKEGAICLNFDKYFSQCKKLYFSIFSVICLILKKKVVKLGQRDGASAEQRQQF